MSDALHAADRAEAVTRRSRDPRPGRRSARVALLGGLLLGGCAESSNTMLRPIDIGERGGLATGAAIRLVTQRERSVGPGTTQMVICSEPSPDVAAALEAALKLAGNASTPSGVSAGGSAEYSMAEHVTELAGRVPQVVALRDGLYQACQAYANGILGQSSYALILSQYGVLLQQLLAPQGGRAAGSGNGGTGNGGGAEGSGSGPQNLTINLASGTVQTAAPRGVTGNGGGTAGAGAPGTGASAAGTSAVATTIDQDSRQHALLVACISEFDPTRIGYRGADGVGQRSELLDIGFCRSVLRAAVGTAASAARPAPGRGRR